MQVGEDCDFTIIVLRTLVISASIDSGDIFGVVVVAVFPSVADVVVSFGADMISNNLSNMASCGGGMGESTSTDDGTGSSMPSSDLHETESVNDTSISTQIGPYLSAALSLCFPSNSELCSLWSDILDASVATESPISARWSSLYTLHSHGVSAEMKML